MMNRTIFRIFISFVLLSALISTILLGINFLSIVFLGNDTSSVYPNTPRYVLEQTANNLCFTDDGIGLSDSDIIPDDNWCILLDEGGDIIWSHNRPEDIPTHYSINDVAKMTRWFLNDYPVYIRAENYGLLVLGIPKNAVGKYDIEYSVDWFDTLPKRIFKVFALNLAFAAVLACLFGANLYRRLRLLTKGINDLRLEKRVHIKEKGLFRELIKNINDSSQAIERKNAQLSERDKARSNWIAGISHDIRTPLSLISGYSEYLAALPELSEDSKKKAQTISVQSMKIKRLIDDLNLISSLEYDMQPAHKKPIRICPLLRELVSDIINSGLSESFEISLDLRCEQAVVLGDKALIERALFNLISNCIRHNENGCNIEISAYAHKQRLYIKIADDGVGIKDEVIARIGAIPKAAHGLGLPLAYRIFCVHGGNLTVENVGGTVVLIELPME